MTNNIKDNSRQEKPPRVFVEHPGLTPEMASTGIMSLVPTSVLTDDQIARALAGRDEPSDWQRSGPETKSKNAARCRVLAQEIYSAERGKPNVSKAEARRRTVEQLDKLAQKGIKVRVYRADSLRKFVSG